MKVIRIESLILKPYLHCASDQLMCPMYITTSFPPYFQKTFQLVRTTAHNSRKVKFPISMIHL